MYELHILHRIIGSYNSSEKVVICQKMPSFLTVLYGLLTPILCHIVIHFIFLHHTNSSYLQCDRFCLLTAIMATFIELRANGKLFHIMVVR